MATTWPLAVASAFAAASGALLFSEEKQIYTTVITNGSHTNIYNTHDKG